MNGRQVIAWICQKILLFALLFTGLAMLALSQVSEFRVRLANVLLQDGFLWGRIGVALLVSYVFLRLGSQMAYRGHWLRIKMGHHTSAVDVQLIRKIIEEKMAHPVEKVSVWRGRLEIQFADPVLKGEELTDWLVKTEAVLAPFFRERFGYANPFILSLSQKKKF